MELKSCMIATVDALEGYTITEYFGHCAGQTGFSKTDPVILVQRAIEDMTQAACRHNNTNAILGVHTTMLKVSQESGIYVSALVTGTAVHVEPIRTGSAPKMGSQKQQGLELEIPVVNYSLECPVRACSVLLSRHEPIEARVCLHAFQNVKLRGLQVKISLRTVFEEVYDLPLLRFGQCEPVGDELYTYALPVGLTREQALSVTSAQVQLVSLVLDKGPVTPPPADKISPLTPDELSVLKSNAGMYAVVPKEELDASTWQCSCGSLNRGGACPLCRGSMEKRELGVDFTSLYKFLSSRRSAVEVLETLENMELPLELPPFTSVLERLRVLCAQEESGLSYYRDAMKVLQEEFQLS